jgi:hypothetical protein
MKKQLVAFAFALFSITAFSSTVLAADAAGTHATRPAVANPALDIPIVGTFLDGTFAGTLDITQFTAKGGVLYAVGSLTGTLTNALGGVVGTVTDMRVLLPVSQISGTCDILNLVLGPLDLNLLGLQVHLDQVVLDITAQSGAGNLLGNLLCAVAGLLDSNGSLSAISRLLNQILGALG